MLKCELTDKGRLEVELQGTVKEIASDSVVLIAEIYRKMLDINADHAYLYRMLVTVGLHETIEMVNKVTK